MASTVRMDLIEKAAELLNGHEPATLRRVAAAAGTSTMAVYTHFGGMPGLWAAVRQEGFTRLARRLHGVERTEDAARDLTAIGSAYVANALANPDLYQTMFGPRTGLDDPEAAEATFGVLVGGVRRVCDGGRFVDSTDPAAAATQLWALTHGMLTLVLAGALPLDSLGMHLPAMTAAAYVGFGDRPDLARRSVDAGWLTADQLLALANTGRRTR
jgi:AcrR family transcriptional regulator